MRSTAVALIALAAPLFAQDDPIQLFRSRVYVPLTRPAPALLPPEIEYQVLLTLPDGKTKAHEPPGYLFKAKELFAIEVKAPFDGFVYLLQDNLKPGQEALLFPDGSQNNQVKTGQTLRLPPDSNLKIRDAQAPQHFYIVFAQTPPNELQIISPDLPQVLKQLSDRARGDRTLAVREITIATR